MGLAMLASMAASLFAPESAPDQSARLSGCNPGLIPMSWNKTAAAEPERERASEQRDGARDKRKEQQRQRGRPCIHLASA